MSGGDTLLTKICKRLYVRDEKNERSRMTPSFFACLSLYFYLEQLSRQWRKVLR